MCHYLNIYVSLIYGEKKQLHNLTGIVLILIYYYLFLVCFSDGGYWYNLIFCDINEICLLVFKQTIYESLMDYVKAVEDDKVSGFSSLV